MKRDLPDDELRAADLLSELMREFLAPPPRLTVTEWAERNRVLSGKDSSEPGPYRVARTPYAREPQDALSAYSAVEEVVLMWGAQTSKSTIGMNWIGSLIDLQPGPLMVVQPTLDIGKRFSRQRLAPMIEESPTLKRRVRENRSRDEANTTLLKEYPGGFLAVAGANSAAGLRSMPIRDLFLDEVDAYPVDVDGEGDPVQLAVARQTTFARRKRCLTSTPTIQGQSRIEDAFKATDQRYFHVACPHCGELQRLVWGAKEAYGVKWKKGPAGEDLPHTAYYICQHTGCIIEEHHKPAMLAGGQWLPSNPSADPRKRGYHLSSLYSPLGWLSWAEMVREWLVAMELQRLGDTSKLRTFVNTRLAETFKVEGRGADASALSARAENYSPGIVPRGGLLLTMGVDTQPDRLEARVWAFGRGEESWLVERHIIFGDPNIDEGEAGSPWTRLTEIRRTPLRNWCGAQMLIEACMIDSGGHNTHAVYNYCRAHHSSRVMAAKGASVANKPVLGKPSEVDVNWRGKAMRGGVRLWPIGTDTAKHLLYGRMRLSQPGAGYVHVPEAYKATDEFEQMTSERLMPAVVNGRQQFRWMLTAGKRNEAGDCMVYAYAAAVWLGLPTFREASWSRREEKFAPREPGLFDAGAGAADAAEPEQKEAPALAESAQNATETIAKPAASEAPAPRQTLSAAPAALKPQFTRKW